MHFSGVFILLSSLQASGAEWNTVRLDPPNIAFPGPHSGQSIIVTATDAAGQERDVTSSARITSADPAIVEVQPDSNRLWAHSPGRTQVRVSLGNATSTADVTVGNRPGNLGVSFSRDILSILTIKGCNGSGCHGSPAGKNGFKLSLFGYDARADHDMIVNAGGGRRLDLKDPQQSLLLRKTSFAIPHGGGRILPADSAEYQMVLNWLQQGAPLDTAGPYLLRMDVYPAERILAGGDARQRLVVVGRLSDGTTRDMTSEVRYSSSGESVVKVAEDGTVAAVAPGLTTVLARAMGKAATSQIIVIVKASAIHDRAVEANNFIDDLVFAKLRKMNVPAAPLSSDEDFLRRVYVDVLGRLPSPRERRRFLSDARAERRQHLIDELLEQPEYAAYRGVKFEDWFRSTQLFHQGRSMGSFKDWLREQAAQDRPYDQMVRDLLTSVGDNNRNPATNFWFPAIEFMVNRFDVKQVTPTVSRLFLGVRMECAECHNHPLENFTQDDFYGLAAFFGRMTVKTGHGVFRRTIYLKDAGEVEHPVTKQPVRPRFLADATPDIPEKMDRRAVLADWIVGPDNPFFSRAAVNRMWHEYFGTGIVEPFDDFRSTNPPTNRELLDRLARYFVDRGFRLKALTKVILNSRAYQLSSRAPIGSGTSEDLDRVLFARYFPRKLPAEVLIDAISQVTAAPHKFGAHPLGISAKDYYPPDAPPYFLSTFGFSRRDVLSERNETPSLSQALHMLNGDTVRDKIGAEGNVVGELMGRNASDAEVFSELFERAYTRLPTEAEAAVLSRHVADQQAAGLERRRILEGILLVVLNSKEFQLNH